MNWKNKGYDMKYKSQFTEAVPESNGTLSEVMDDFNKAFAKSVLFVVHERDDSSDKDNPKYIFAFKYSVRDDPFIEEAIYSGETIVKPSEKAFDVVKGVLSKYGLRPAYNKSKTKFMAGK